MRRLCNVANDKPKRVAKPNALPHIMGGKEQGPTRGSCLSFPKARTSSNSRLQRHEDYARGTPGKQQKGQLQACTESLEEMALGS